MAYPARECLRTATARPTGFTSTGRHVAQQQSGVVPPQSKTDAAAPRPYPRIRLAFRTVGIKQREWWVLRAAEGLIYLNKSRFGVRVLP